MADRYQPGASLLSFLNPRSMYYTDFGTAPAKLAETKAVLADALIDNKKDPRNVLKLTPNEKAAVKEVVAEVKSELPASIAPEGPKPTAAPALPANPVVAPAKVTPPPEVVAAADAAKAEAKANATVAAIQGAAELTKSSAVAAGAKADVAAVTNAVKADAVAPGVEAGPGAKAVAAAVNQAKKDGFCPCKLLAWKRKKAKTAGEQAKNAVEGFINRECFSIGLGPSKLISNIEIAGVNLKDILTGGRKPAAAKDGVEKFCDNNWHGIASTIVVLLSLVIMIILCLGVFGLLHVVFDIRKGPNPTLMQPVM